MKRILVAKFGACAGQACIGIDYVLVEKSFSSTLVRSLKEPCTILIVLLFVTLILKLGYLFFSSGDNNEGLD